MVTLRVLLSASSSWSSPENEHDIEMLVVAQVVDDQETTSGKPEILLFIKTERGLSSAYVLRRFVGEVEAVEWDPKLRGTMVDPRAYGRNADDLTDGEMPYPDSLWDALELLGLDNYAQNLSEVTLHTDSLKAVIEGF